MLFPEDQCHQSSSTRQNIEHGLSSDELAFPIEWVKISLQTHPCTLTSSFGGILVIGWWDSHK